MLVDLHINPHRPFPRRLITYGIRETALVFLIDPFQDALALVHHVKAKEGDYIPTQGGVWLPRERLARTARREVREELGITRPHPHATPVSDWRQALYLGSFVNQGRGGRQKRYHAIAVRLRQRARLRPDGVECDDALWVRGNEELGLLLRITLQENPMKGRGILAATYAAHQCGLLG